MTDTISYPSYVSCMCNDTSSVPVIVTPSVATCHDPLPPMKSSIGGYTSTVEGLVVAFYCNEELIPWDQSFITVAGQMNTTCASNGSWSPNPADWSIMSHRLMVISGTVSNNFILATARRISDSYVRIYIAYTQDGFHGAQLSYSIPEGSR